jgi:hypothetical protein
MFQDLSAVEDKNVNSVGRLRTKTIVSATGCPPYFPGMNDTHEYEVQAIREACGRKEYVTTAYVTLNGKLSGPVAAYLTVEDWLVDWFAPYAEPRQVTTWVEDWGVYVR